MKDEIIKIGSTALFTFPGGFEHNFSAMDWYNSGIKTSLGSRLDYNTVSKLERCKITICANTSKGYYDIVFHNLYDLDGNTVLRYNGVSDIHFMNVESPKVLEEKMKLDIPVEVMNSGLAEEKRRILDDMISEIDEKYINDENITTRMMLDILINKCNRLKSLVFI